MNTSLLGKLQQVVKKDISGRKRETIPDRLVVSCRRGKKDWENGKVKKERVNHCGCLLFFKD